MKEKHNENVVDLFFANSIDLLCVADKNGLFVKLNPEWEKTLGYSLKELEGKPYIDFVHPEDIEATNKATKQLINNQQVDNFINRYRHKNGKYHWIEWRSFPADNKIFASARDITEKVTIEKRLQESEERNRSITSLTTDFIYWMDINNKGEKTITYVSDNFETLTGIKPEKIRILTDRNKLIHPDDLQKITDFNNRVIHKGENYSIDCRAIVRDEIRWINILGKPVRDISTGRVTSYYGAVKDITDRKMTELKLRESETRYRALIEEQVDLVSRYLPDTTLTFVNDAYCKFYGQKREDLIGNSYLFLIAPEFRDLVKEETRTLAENKGSVVGEYVNLRHDGEKCWIQWSVQCITNENNEVTELQAVGRDVSKIKETQEKVKELLVLRQTILDTMTAGIAYVIDRKIQWTNRALCNMFELEPDEVIDHDTSILYKDLDDYNRVGAKAYPAIKRSEIYSEVLETRKKNGDILYIHLTGKAINPKNINEGSIWMLQDITESKKAEEVIKKLNADLEKKVKERTRELYAVNKELELLAYSVSHDLRAPLRHIDGFIKLLFSSIESPGATITGYYEKIIAASKRMSLMIDELLKFSRLGRKELKIVPVDIALLIKEIIEQSKPDFAERNIKWEIHKLPTIPGDMFLLKIAFENIISNSIKYTSKKQAAQIIIGVKPSSKEHVTIFVKDNGAGFDMSNSNKLFGIFQRLHNTSEFEGIGIGLANAKQIITKHRGTIEAESEINKGATFYITLPKK
ncbi:MAG: PAS domain S-box protein [Bacteroidales bacterium]|nr:PAS domain S-box protein [Bacteroidales bacterium]